MAGAEPPVDPFAPAPGVTVLGHVIDPLTPDYGVWLCRWADPAAAAQGLARLVFCTRRTGTGTAGQRSVPYEAGPWLYDTITLGFWRPPGEGGVPRGTNAVTRAFGPERLELRRGWGFGGPQEPGFTLTSLDRLSALGLPWELPFSDELLITGGLLALLARLA